MLKFIYKYPSGIDWKIKTGVDGFIKKRFIKDYLDMYIWLLMNFKKYKWQILKKYDIDIYGDIKIYDVYFINKKDALLFKIRWS